jgi:hypothetical protein
VVWLENDALIVATQGRQLKHKKNKPQTRYQSGNNLIYLQ